MSELPLYKQIQQDIKKRIATGRLREGDRIPSESELINQYFVSAITAKNALYGLVDEGIIYRVKGKGSFVAPSPFPADHPLNTLHVGDEPEGSERTIGIIFPGCRTGIESHMLSVLDTLCQREGIQYFVRFSNDRAEMEISLIRQFIKTGIQGLILFPILSELSNAAVRQLLAGRFPFVFIDRYLTDIPAPAVTADNVGGAQLATNHLVERCGEDIALFYKPEANTAVIERVEGFGSAMLKCGYALKPDMLCKLPISIDEEASPLIYEKIVEFLLERPNLKGAFAINMGIARCAYYALLAVGRKPGVDFHLVGFDNPLLQGVPFIQQDIAKMVSVAMETLENQMRGNITLNRHSIETRLIDIAHEDIPMDQLNYLTDALI